MFQAHVSNFSHPRSKSLFLFEFCGILLCGVFKFAAIKPGKHREFWKPCTDQFFVLERVQAKVGVRDYEVTAVARSAGNRMEVSASAVTLATSDQPENVQTHNRPWEIFHSG